MTHERPDLLLRRDVPASTGAAAAFSLTGRLDGDGDLSGTIDASGSLPVAPIYLRNADEIVV